MIPFIRNTRNTQTSCIGVEMTDTQIRFIELTARGNGVLIPKKFGTVGITFDVVKQGEIITRAPVIESLKRLRAKTQALEVRFPTCGNPVWDAVWSEVFVVAGFPHARAIDAKLALDLYLFGSEEKLGSQVAAYFLSPTQLEIHRRDGSHTKYHVYQYPLQVQDAASIARMTETSLLKRISVSGYLPDKSHKVIRALDSVGIDAFTLEVWKRCFSYSQYVPDLSREDAFKFTQAVALAYHGATVREAHGYVPSLFVQKKPVKAVTRELTVQENYKHITPVSTPSSEKEVDDAQLRPAPKTKQAQATSSSVAEHFENKTALQVEKKDKDTDKNETTGIFRKILSWFSRGA